MPDIGNIYAIKRVLTTRGILEFSWIEVFGKNLIKIGRFQMTQYIGCRMENACLAYVKVSGIFPA